MELRKLSDRIYYLPNEEETDRPALGYVRGERLSLAVDAGNSPRHVEKFYAELKAAGLRLPDYTAITHWHWDHTFGMCAVAGTTIAARLTNEKLREVAAWKWSDADMKDRLASGADIEMCDRCIKLEYPNRSKIRVVAAELEFSGRLTLDLGGITCEICEVTAPHSRDSILVYIPEEKTLFVGDAECEDYYENHGLYDPEKLNAYIERIRRFDFETYVLGHSEPQSRQEALTYLEGEAAKLAH